MPIFEFVCTECDEFFEDLVLSRSKIVDVVYPSCGGGKVKKKMSAFASKPVEGTSPFSLGRGSAPSSSTGSV